MPNCKTRHFKVQTCVGVSTSSATTLPKGSSEPHTVVVTPLSGIPKRTQVFCVRSHGTAADYDPVPPDAWDHDFGLIDCSSPVASCTANHAVTAGHASGTVTLRVKELHVDDGLPSPRVDSILLDIHVTVS